ncbi:MAG: hypothetical protein GX146_13085 [Myxococcales bacterium]|nr:hypothetical protein [Myxococcales bacterium]
MKSPFASVRHFAGVAALSFAACWLLPALLLGQVLLPVAQNPQEQSEWCWAASSQSVLRAYGQTPSQCDIATFARQKNPNLLGNGTCCNMPGGFYSSEACNMWNYNWGYPGSIQDILQQWGVSSTGLGHMGGNPFPYDQVRAEIDAGRPFIIRWGHAQGGHFAVGYGYLSDAQQTMYVFDPWPSEGAKIAAWSQVNNGILPGYKWEHTNVMTSNPPPIDTDTDTGPPVDTDTDTGPPVSTDTWSRPDSDTGAPVSTDTWSRPDSDTGAPVSTDTWSRPDSDTWNPTPDTNAWPGQDTSGTWPPTGIDDNDDNDDYDDNGSARLGDDDCGCATPGSPARTTSLLRLLLAWP